RISPPSLHAALPISSVVMIYAAGSIGLAKSSHGQAVLSRTMIFDTFPFSRQRNAVAVGDVGTVRSDRAIGNIIADSSFGGGGMIDREHTSELQSREK